MRRTEKKTMHGNVNGIKITVRVFWKRSVNIIQRIAGGEGSTTKPTDGAFGLPELLVCIDERASL